MTRCLRNFFSHRRRPTASNFQIRTIWFSIWSTSTIIQWFGKATLSLNILHLNQESVSKHRMTWSLPFGQFTWEDSSPGVVNWSFTNKADIRLVGISSCFVWRQNVGVQVDATFNCCQSWCFLGSWALLRGRDGGVGQEVKGLEEMRLWDATWRDMWKVLCALYLGCAGTSSHKQVISKSSISLPSLFSSFFIIFSLLLHPVLPQRVSSREPLCSSFLLMSNQGYVSVSLEVSESHRKSLFVELVLVVYHILFLSTFGLSKNCQIGFLIYVASNIPGVDLRGYETIGDCEATSFLFFSQMHWNQSMPSFEQKSAKG